MEELNQAVLTRAAQLNEYATPTWEKLPKIPLYLDQVVGYLEGELAALLADEGDKSITPSMINNYVKAGVVAPPLKKKYSQAQLASLLTIHSLKQVLPIGRLRTLYGLFGQDAQGMMQEFSAVQDDALRTSAALMSDAMDGRTGEQAEKALRSLVLECALGAASMRMAALSILKILEDRQKPQKDDKQKG